MMLGNIPRQADVVVGLERFDQLVEHDDANLTATVQAGVKVAVLQDLLGRRQQFLAIDPPHPRRATIGGIAAANTNGPRRMLFGSVRDLVIGMKMVLPTGERVKAGGKVVKNVAGYDMCKLFVGSLGTLGIITEVTWKMAPLPETAATILAVGPLAQTLHLADDVLASTLLPAGLVLLSSTVVEASAMGAGHPALAVWAEGFEEAVARHLRDVRTMAERHELPTEVLRKEAHQRVWASVREFGAADTSRVVYRVTVPPASVAAVVMAVDQWSTHERVARYLSHAGTGTVWVSLDADPSSRHWFPKLISLAHEHGGHATMMAAPPAVKEGVDVWGPLPASFPIMREIKQRFDPHGLLNPGRFVGGL
jgi:glycolate oxidase FAD binding subunit